MRLFTLSAILIAASLAASPAFAKKSQPAAPQAASEAAATPLGMALLSATVDSIGALHQNSGAASASKDAPGIYHVTFVRPVDQCVYAATSGFWFPLAEPDQVGLVNATPLEGAADTVAVRTTNLSGVQANNNFHLLVFCAR